MNETDLEQLEIEEKLERIKTLRLNRKIDTAKTIILATFIGLLVYLYLTDNLTSIYEMIFS